MSKNVGRLIGDRIRAVLDEIGENQAWLAERAGIQPGYLSELMNGHPKKRWNEDTLNSVANALSVSLARIAPGYGEFNRWELEQLENLRQLDEEGRQAFENMLKLWPKGNNDG